MKRVIVLGAGLVGKAMAIDLCGDYQVAVADRNERRLAELSEEHLVYPIIADLSHEGEIEKLVADYDLVIGAVPGFMGFDTLRRVIAAGKDIVDISFFPEDPFQLDDLARQAGVTAIVDCGVAPGMSNFILGYYQARMKVESFVCYVGGLPVVRLWPFEYKAPFSPVDVIEEYIRPARYVENGRVVTRPALSDPELIDFPKVGTLEAFNTDGLRTLIKTCRVPNMKEKTLRYPGHIEKIRFLKAAGFFSTEPVEIDGKPIRPFDFTTKMLLPAWELRPEEEEFTVMRIIIEGEEKGRRQRIQWDMLDRYDRETGLSSMARTTGFAATAVARLLLESDFEHPGICPPELIGAVPEHFSRIMKYLSQRNIIYRMSTAES